MQVSGNKTVSSDFLRVLLALKKNTMRDNNVAEVCLVQDISQSEIRCNTLSSDSVIVCEKLQDLEIQKNDVVLVVFTNTDFRQNLKRIKSNQKSVKNQDEILHSLNYGVVIGLIYRKNQEES